MALILLVKHPAKLAKLLDELCMAVPNVSSENLPHHDTLKSLPYLNAVINETMRLWPVGLGEL
jgi:cytochrome P450